MTNQIEVDDEVFGVLKAKAEPFVDTPNSVLRRLLGVDPAKQGSAVAVPTPTSSSTTPPPVRPAAARKPKTKGKASSKRTPTKRTRAARGTLLPEDRYEAPLLRALVEAGGQAAYREVVDAVGRELKSEFMPADFENLDSGSVRWQSRIQFVRLRLIERGYLDRETPRGIWGITDLGRKALAEASDS